MNNSIKKGVVVAVIILFISVSVIPLTVGINEEKQIVKENKLSFDHLYYNGLWTSPDEIHYDIINPFNLWMPKGQNYKTAYSDKDFSIKSNGHSSPFTRKYNNPSLL